MRTADWPSITTTKVLLIGENSTLQWKDEVLEHAMFLDYYFNHAPYDLGERSRYSEARTIFEVIVEMTSGEYHPEQVHGTLLSNAILDRPPKGKHILIPQSEVVEGVEHIKGLIAKYPTIEYILVMGMQTNYYLQKHGLYNSGDLSESFLKGAEPRRVGLSSIEPFYQPVNAKPFRQICFKEFEINGNPNIKVIPMLPVKSYPLSGSELMNFGENFDSLKGEFALRARSKK